MDQPRFPEPDAGELIHTRTYEVRTYKLTPNSFLLRGVVCDEKPAGLYIPDDPEPLPERIVIDALAAGAFGNWRTIKRKVKARRREAQHDGARLIHRW